MNIDMQPVTLVDPHQVADVFASGLGEIEDFGGCYRFTLYARQVGSEECIVAARIIVSRECLPAILFIAARHVGLSLVKVVTFISGTIH